jgi:predicted dithiol-disulfide oxidoreductase (DUF899 family)
MNTNTESAIKFPKIVDQAEWQKARDALLVKEKAATRARDALAAERRRLPMVRMDIWTFLDLTPLGRQEIWEDLPAGGPRAKPGSWWRRHDEYGKDGGGQHP